MKKRPELEKIKKHMIHDESWLGWQKVVELIDFALELEAERKDIIEKWSKDVTYWKGEHGKLLDVNGELEAVERAVEVLSRLDPLLIGTKENLQTALKNI